MRKVPVTTGGIAQEAQRILRSSALPLVTLVGGIELSITLQGKTVRREVSRAEKRLGLDSFSHEILVPLLKELK